MGLPVVLSSQEVDLAQVTTMSGSWITKKRKRAINIERDNSTCCYCGKTVITGANLLNGYTPDQVASLDHIECRANGGDNTSTNLITCCLSCNASRKTKSLVEFCGIEKAAKILEHVSIPFEYNRKTRKYERAF